MVNSNNTKENQTKKIDPTMNPGSVYYLHPSNSSQNLVNITFSKTGFVDWKRVMTIALNEKNRMVFVDSSLPKPSNNGVGLAWERANNVVMGWIIGVLEESIAKSVLSYKTAKDIWNELNERYGQSSNSSTSLTRIVKSDSESDNYSLYSNQIIFLGSSPTRVGF